MHRRFLLSAFASAAALPALAQGKKGAGDAGLGTTTTSPGSMGRVLGIDGLYTSFGVNPDQSTYDGRAEIVQQGTAIEITWAIGDSMNRGAGQIDGRILTVDWGAATPVIYVVMDDGELHGTWDDGLALEKLTPG